MSFRREFGKVIGWMGIILIGWFALTHIVFLFFPQHGVRP